ncbi:MAG: carboxylesterase family protein [Coriobacteriales bacterium]
MKTRTGIIRGVDVNDDVEAFLGIPYAKPPVGELRWRAPEPLANSQEVIVCDEFGASAMQEIDEVELASLHRQSEDCLTLNIWRPMKKVESLPVMVYIHGGAYFSGGSADPLYNGANFVAAHDVVLVSINYRINVFGSLCLTALPDGESYTEAGYLNILDQIQALTWINENIAAFGGDPANITLFGESAGSASAALLAVCPRAKGLFQRIICESGPIDLYKTREKGEPYALELAEILGCETVAEMQQKTSQELIDAMSILCERHPFEVSLTYAPVCDGTLLPEKPMRAWKDGAAKDLDVMIGSTEDEFNYFTFYFKPEEMPDFWRGQTPFHFDESLDIRDWERVYDEAYPERDLVENYVDFMNQTGFRVMGDLMAEQQSAYGPVYDYLFRYKSTIDGMGSCHAIEVPFVLRNLDTPDGLEFTGPNPPEHLADEMSAAWYAFAKDGRPVAPGGDMWAPYNAQDHVHMVIDEKGWTEERDINERNNDLFRPMYDVLLNA